jgi:8-oxo-dGTP pyrophosphatase MutT (NUDIX family)
MTTPFRIGVGGHQNLGDPETERFVAHEFRQLLTTYLHRQQPIVLYSALALGADQLFIQTALELGVPVEAVLPCIPYETIFPSEEARATYRRLLHACQSSHQLPALECSDEAYLAAGQWIVDHCNLLILAWNGLPARGRGGTAEMASYARWMNRPFVHLDTRRHTVQRYDASPSGTAASRSVAPKREFVTARQTVYQGSVLTVNQYRLRMPDGEEIVRDIAELPESLLVVPVAQGQNDAMVLLIEEYDLGAGSWHLRLPGGKVEANSGEDILEQAQRELRQELGYRAGQLERLIRFSSHPGYIAHRVQAFVARDLVWDPLPPDAHEEIKVQTSPLKEALAATLEDDRFDPEAALALWLYAHKFQA